MTSWFILKNHDEITLNITASINKSRPILPDFHHIDPSKYLLHLLVHSVVELFHEKSCKTYIIISQELSTAITNAILCPATPLVYKSLQHVVTEDYRCRVI